MSAYLVKLQSENPDVATRYLQKLCIINNVDPYTLKERDLSYNAADFPPVSNMDIVSYLVLTTSFYTGQQMKAYKSLHAYKYFEAGFVTQCGTVNINNHFIILAKVKHSQRMNEPPLQVWIISNVDGSIESGHCTCMAGAGEVCSHVGAVLYALEFIDTSKSNTSCTDVRSLWNVPKLSKVECEPIKNINYGKPISFPKMNECSVPAITGEELKKMLQQIDESGSQSVLMRVVEPFASAVEIRELIPNPFTDLYNQEYEELTYEQLVQLSHEYVNINLSDEECTKIKEATKAQASSREWFHQRSGRITASKLKDICRTSINKPSASLIKVICYPQKFLFKSKATLWGIKHEVHALDAYKSEQNITHFNLSIERVGFCINPELSRFGASPDAIVTCSCCGTGCVEVKCPYLLEDMTIEQFADLKMSCLLKTETSDIYLDKKHSYYYQVQQQMAVTRFSYCDFVVWGPQEIFIERVPFNEDFWHQALQKATEFHKNVIVPELLGQYFTRKKTTDILWCICKEPDNGRPMVCCDNDNCDIKWYHFECVGITKPPTDIWTCSLCS